MGLRYVFPSTGHCGSRYIAALLCSVGVPCGHEKTFRAGISRHYVNSNIYVAESSAFAAPFLNLPICEGAKIVHVVRHPLRVLRSWLYGKGDWGHVSRPFFCEVLAQHDAWPFTLPLSSGYTDECNPNWLAAFWVAWNRLIERKSSGAPVFHVEHGPALLDLLDIEHDPTAIKDDRRNNSHTQHEAELSFDIVSEPAIRTAILGMTHRYGYPENPQEMTA